MPLKLDIGPRIFEQASAVSSLSVTPQYDREMEVRRVLIFNVSASDTWVVTVGGKEIMRFLINTTGNNQLCGGIFGNFPRVRDIFTYFHRVFGYPLSIPVPQGIPITVSSVGGATATIILVGVDLTPGSISQSMLNHYAGSHSIMPVYGSVAAAITAIGETAFDTTVKPAWVADLFTGKATPLGFQYHVLAAFIEAAAVNTFSGAANHQSATDHIGVTYNGEHMFTHIMQGQVSGGASGITTVPAGQLVTPAGIPNVSQPSAAGSANTVFGQNTDVFPAFQNISEEPQSVIDPPFFIKGGDTVQFYQGITGDVTGGASYAGATVCLLVDVLKVG